MKRILLSLALAVAIHGYLLGSEPEWLKVKPTVTPKPRVITMTLTYRLPPGPEPKPPAKPPKIHIKKRPSLPKKDKPQLAKPKLDKPKLNKPRMEKPQLDKPKPVPKPRVPKKDKKRTKKILSPIKKEVRPPKKRTKPKRITTEPPPKRVIATLESKNDSSTKTVMVPPRLEPVSEPGKPKITKKPSDPLYDIPDDVLKEPGSEEEAQIASLPPTQPPRKARPAYKKNPRPEYPRVARRRRYQGTTLLEVLVGTTGKANDIRVLKSSGFDILDRAAVTAVKSWLFEPGMREGERVEMWVRVPIRFQLK